MPTLYPLRFHPLLRHYLWGGRKLVEQFGKSDGGQAVVAESWEICDRGADQSVVAFGPLAGESLGAIAQRYPRELYGDRPPPARFPLLFKLLDAAQPLSVQVHPNDAQAAKLDPPDLGKTEAWVILSAAPGSVVYAGLKRGFDRAALAREVARGTTDLCLHRFEPRAGDCIFIPAGTVHALGAGLVVAEIQQSSDTTYRLYDWNRVGPDGQPRPLHVEQALAVVDDRIGPVSPQTPTQLPESNDTAHGERLVACDKFVLDRWTLSAPHEFGGDGKMRILAVTSEELSLSGDPANRPLAAGKCALLPGEVGCVTVTPCASATLLLVTLP